MIKNFENKLQYETALNIPVWGASKQNYIVMSTHEATHNDGWKAEINTKWQITDHIVPQDIVVELIKYNTQMEWDVQVVYTDEAGFNPLKRNVMVLPKHLKSPETLSKLIADIINEPSINYFN